MTFAEIATMTGETLTMTFLSTLFAYILGLPCGVLLNVTSKNGIKPCKWINFIVGLIVNVVPYRHRAVYSVDEGLVR